MNEEHAKKDFRAARPHGQDDDDPRIAAAIRALKGRSGGADWLHRRRSHDAEIADQLASTPVPPGLRDAVHERMRTTLEARPTKRSFAATSRWNRVAAFAAVVALTFGLGLSIWLQYTKVQFARESQFGDAMAYYIAEVPFILDYRSDNLTSIRQWLAHADAPVVDELPAVLADRLPKGCRKIDWNGVEVSLICFYESLPGNRIVHLFMARREAVPESAIAGIEQLLIRHGLETRGWLTDDYVCLIVPSKANMRVGQYLAAIGMQ